MFSSCTTLMLHCREKNNNKKKTKTQADRRCKLFVTFVELSLCVEERDERDPLTRGDTLAACNFKISHSDDEATRRGSCEYSHH